EQFLPLYGELARLAATALKPDGILAVMAGQSYLPRIFRDMVRHLEYRWMCAYYLPQLATKIWPRKIHSRWKPVLLFTRPGAEPKWVRDTFTVESVNDAHKALHDWEQSLTGMTALVEALSEPGNVVCDPFVGAGTTAVAAVRLGRRFIGCHMDET